MASPRGMEEGEEGDGGAASVPMHMLPMAAIIMGGEAVAWIISRKKALFSSVTA